MESITYYQAPTLLVYIPSFSEVLWNVFYTATTAGICGSGS